jgi:glutathione synthase/RimK-type ligase-like ATP-grasp enzyme
MRFIILTRFHSQHAQGEFVIRLAAAANELGHSFNIINPADIYMDFSRGIMPQAGGSSSLPDCPVRWKELQFPASDLVLPIARWDDDYTWQIVETLRAWGQPVFPNNRIPLGDSVTMARLFTRRGIPTPRTWVLTQADQFTVIQPELSFPCLLRSRHGGSGRQFSIAQHSGEGMELATKFSQAGQPFVVQDLPQPWGEDVRILMVGSRVMASVLRRAPVGFVRPRESGNLGASLVELTDEEVLLAQQAAAIYSAPFCTVSILRTPTGPLMLEVSRAPVLSEMEAVTGLNLALPIIEHLVHLAQTAPSGTANVVPMPTARL